MTANKQTAPARVTTTEFDEHSPLLNEVLEATSRRLDAIASRYAEAIHNNALGRLGRAVTLAEGISRLRKAITADFMVTVMNLMNSPLGFRTDLPSKKNPRRYTVDEVRECLIAALLEGVYPFGNEFNIIAGQLYIAQNGYRRKVKEIAGLTDLEVSPGIPMVHNGQTCVRVGATWKLNGAKQELNGSDGKPGRTFAIISNEYASPDALVGKAVRKALKAIYDQVTGSEHSAPDGEVGEAISTGEPQTVRDAKSRTEEVAAKLGAKPNGQQPNEPEALPAAQEPEPQAEYVEKPNLWAQELAAKIDSMIEEANDVRGLYDAGQLLEDNAGSIGTLYDGRKAKYQERYQSLTKAPKQERQKELTAADVGPYGQA